MPYLKRPVYAKYFKQAQEWLEIDLTKNNEYKIDAPEAVVYMSLEQLIGLRDALSREIDICLKKSEKS